MTKEPSSNSAAVEKEKESKSQKKKSKNAMQKEHFSDASCSNLSRALGPNDWIRLAQTLGFLPKAIAHFIGRASSSQNSSSQCALMLRTWRDLTKPDEILPRLSRALQQIRRHDLALKIGLELGVYATKDEEEKDEDESKHSKLQFSANTEDEDVTEEEHSEETNITFNEKNMSFLARHILGSGEWERLAHAMEFTDKDVSRIKASASSSQNNYAQAYAMLVESRSRITPSKIERKLRKALTKIRRQDLVFLLEIGVIVETENSDSETPDEKLARLYKEAKEAQPKRWGEKLYEERFPKQKRILDGQ